MRHNEGKKNETNMIKTGKKKSLDPTYTITIASECVLCSCQHKAFCWKFANVFFFVLFSLMLSHFCLSSRVWRKQNFSIL